MIFNKIINESQLEICYKMLKHLFITNHKGNRLTLRHISIDREYPIRFVQQRKMIYFILQNCYNYVRILIKDLKAIFIYN